MSAVDVDQRQRTNENGCDVSGSRHRIRDRHAHGFTRCSQHCVHVIAGVRHRDHCGAVRRSRRLRGCFVMMRSVAHTSGQVMMVRSRLVTARTTRVSCTGCLTDVAGHRCTDDHESECERQQTASHPDHGNSNQRPEERFAPEEVVSIADPVSNEPSAPQPASCTLDQSPSRTSRGLRLDSARIALANESRTVCPAPPPRVEVHRRHFLRTQRSVDRVCRSGAGRPR